MPSVLLDSHILVWWRVNPERLSKPQASLLLEMEKHREPAAISAITLREIAWMDACGRLEIAISLDARSGFPAGFRRSDYRGDREIPWATLDDR